MRRIFCAYLLNLRQLNGLKNHLFADWLTASAYSGGFPSPCDK
jgi:hypothetical protein